MLVLVKMLPIILEIPLHRGYTIATGFAHVSRTGEVALGGLSLYNLLFNKLS